MCPLICDKIKGISHEGDDEEIIMIANNTLTNKCDLTVSRRTLPATESTAASRVKVASKEDTSVMSARLGTCGTGISLL